MAKQKRYQISAARRRILTQPGSVYTVRCTGAHCDCQQFGPGCRRGFFSLWIQAIYGRYFASSLGISSYIDFGDKPYLYSDPARFKGNLNFWDYYYVQDSFGPDRIRVPNEFTENYPLRIWKRKHLKKVHEVSVINLELQHKTAEYINSLKEKCIGNNILGVHIRGTDHPDEVPAISLERYIRILKMNSGKYQKFFISTDDHKVLVSLIREFGKERLIFQEAIRSDSDLAVHTNMQYPDRYQLGLEVLADCYCLSVCQKALLAHSNVSYAALLLNPGLTYTLLETWQSRRKRVKASLLYNLDRWGFRKM